MGGKRQVPFLVDTDRNIQMYESDDIIEYLKTVVEKRKDKIRNIAKRFLKQPDSYKRLKQDLEYSAKVYHCSVHELEDPKLEYPEEIEW